MSASGEKIDTRQAKGRHTRERLLAEGLRLFALKGYDGAGTRELAAAAGTNIASIAFHFGGKEGLYAAVIETVSGELARLHQAALAAARAESEALEEGPGQRVRRLVAGLVAGLLTSRRSQWMTLLLQREFITPTASFERIYREAVQPTLEELSRLLGAAGDGVPPLDNKILSFSVFIMASAFARNRSTFLRLAGTDGYSPQDVAAISRVVADFVERGLPGRS